MGINVCFVCLSHHDQRPSRGSARWTRRPPPLLPSLFNSRAEEAKRQEQTGYTRYVFITNDDTAESARLCARAGTAVPVVGFMWLGSLCCPSVSRPYLSRSVFYRIQRFQHCKISPRLPVLRQTPPVPSPAPGRRGVDGWDESWSPGLSGRPRKGIWRLYRDFGQVRGFF